MVGTGQPNIAAASPIEELMEGKANALSRLWAAAVPSAAKASQLTRGITTSLTAVIGALRWGAVMVGLAWAALAAAEGEVRVVITLAVAIFITSWRTIVPIRFGEPGLFPILKATGDVATLALAIGVSDGLSGPFVGSLVIAVAVAGFGWGVGLGLISAGLAVALAALATVAFGPAPLSVDQIPGPVAVTMLLGAAVVPGMALDRLSEIELRRKALADQRDRLAEANELLAVLSGLARTLPSSLDLSDVIAGTRRQMVDTFDAHRIAIVSFEEGYWSPQFQDEFDLPPQLRTPELPSPLDQAALSGDLVRIEDLSRDHDRDGSGLYTRLVVSGVDIGLLAIENREPGRYQESDGDLLRSMSDVLALTLANARSFRRLRSLAAAEERSRIARDLHDRLGQYLTYIALELERINGERDEPSAELKKLHEDVQGAIGEFRDTLIELRASVTSDRPLAVVLTEVVDRFRRRSMVEVGLTVPNSTERLPPIVENELLRIAQEALVNVQKHAAASRVHLRWSLAEGRGVLIIEDDGRGFDPTKGIRGSAYGLVGMRERAASVGAMLEISSAPGQGTTITVQTSQPSEQVKKT